MNNEQKNISDTVLTHIRSGGVRMRSKLYFAVQIALTFIVACAVLALSIFLASYILFVLRINGHESLLSFGWRGVGVFFELIPWALVGADVVLLLVLEWMLRRFKFGYQHSILYLFLFLIVVAGTLGVALDRGTPFHDTLSKHAENNELVFPLTALYEHARRPAPGELGVYRGVVLSVGEETFVMTYDDRDNDGDDGMWTVFPPLGFEIEEVLLGDRVYVAGDRLEDSIRAYGIHILEHEEAEEHED